jgi:cytochrome P450
MMADSSSESGTPVVDDFRFVGRGEAIWGFARYDVLQDEHRVVRIEEPEGAYFLVLDRELVVAGLQDTATFSSRAITPLQPEPRFTAIPVMLDPPEHGKWRKMLASYFAPRRMPLLEARIGARCAELLDELEPRGGCEFVGEFAFRFPTTIFLEIMGLPAAELDLFLEWENAILHAADEDPAGRARQLEAVMLVLNRFREIIAERRASPDIDAGDIVSHSASWEIDGEAVADGDILSCCLLLFMAGLDTVANELSFAMRHLAMHRADRAWLAAEPSRAGAAAEELLRVYSIAQVARKVTTDTVFGGQQLKKGDMVLFSLAAANRDPTYLRDARNVILEREGARNYAFGAGPHRCLGSHLARREIAVALEQWHRRVPEYELASDAPLLGHWGSVHGLTNLPLRWRASGGTVDAADR